MVYNQSDQLEHLTMEQSQMRPRYFTKKMRMQEMFTNFAKVGHYMEIDIYILMGNWGIFIHCNKFYNYYTYSWQKCYKCIHNIQK